MKKSFSIRGAMALLAILSVIALLALVAGCASFLTTANQARYATATLADGGMRAWATYYKSATNNPTAYHTTLQQIESRHQEVDSAAIRVAASMHTVDIFMQAYAANMASQGSAQAALNALAADTANLVSLVSAFTGNTNLVLNQ